MTDAASAVVGLRRDTPVDAMLRRIAVAASGGTSEDAALYGTNFRCSAFEMHRSCSSEDCECVWCGSCTCQYEYRIGDRMVSVGEWNRHHPDHRIVDDYDPEHPFRMVRQGKIVVVSGTCDFCTASGEYREHGALPRMGAPNFWHRASGMRVWWHRYIGRGTLVRGVRNNRGAAQFLARVEDDCKKAIAKQLAHD